MAHCLAVNDISDLLQVILPACRQPQQSDCHPKAAILYLREQMKVLEIGAVAVQGSRSCAMFILQPS